MATLAQEKLTLEFQSNKVLLSNKTLRSGKLVAEGDSWFAYPLVRDIIDHLRKMGYGIHRLSSAGDTLENMVYGTGTEKKGPNQRNKGPESLQRTVQAIKLYKPRFVLFSAGGNDIVGDDMLQFLHHSGSGDAPLNEGRFRAHVDGPMRTALVAFLKAVWAQDPTIDVLMDGYDYARPNGEGYQVIANFSGPWVRPSFVRKGWSDRAVHMEPTVKKLVDIYNGLLKEIAKEYPQFHYIDLRGMFPKESEWHNEIHLKSDGFKAVAMEYHKKMKAILAKAKEEAEVIA